MAAFLLIKARITDPQRFRAYAEAVPPLVARMGGRYRVLGGRAEVLEGPAAAGWAYVVSEWPDAEAARAFWSSAEYAQVKPLREGAAEVEVVLVEGGDEGPPAAG